MTFDPNGGYATRQLIAEYRHLYNRFTESCRIRDTLVNEQPNSDWKKQHPYDGLEHREAEEQLVALLPRVEANVRANRESFTTIFHHLEQVPTEQLEEGLIKYNRDLGEVPGYHEYRGRIAEPFRAQRKYLEDVIFELEKELDKRAKYPPPPPPPPPPPIAPEDDRLARIIELKDKWTRAVEEKPEHEVEINLVYRQRLDEILEEYQ
jgi:hypothetical protein